MLPDLRTNGILLGLLILAACFGCGAPEFEGKLEPVSGKVTINGNAGIDVEVTFLPLQDTSGTGAFTKTDAQGMFTVKHRSGKEGIEAGTYKVVFSQFTKPDGSPIAPDEDGAIVGSEKLPLKYTDFDQTDVTAEVPPGGKYLEFKLKVKAE